MRNSIFFIKKTIFVLVILSLSPSLSFSISCGSCSGCASFLPLLESTSKEIEQEFLKMEKEMADNYASEIIPLLEDNRKLEEEIAVSQAQLELLEKRTLAVNKEIAYIIENIKKVRISNETNKNSKPKEEK